MKRIAGAGLVVMALLVGACSGRAGKPTGATVPTERVTTTTTIDVTKIPDVITVAYANAVMKSLDHVLGDAIRYLVAKKAPDQHFYDLLNAIYDEPAFSRKQSVWGQEAADRMQDFNVSRTGPDHISRQSRPANAHMLLTRRNSPTSTHLLTKMWIRPRLASSPGPECGDAGPTGQGPTAWSIEFDADMQATPAKGHHATKGVLTIVGCPC